ncbi:hypothetical protein BN1221_03098 [Brenneria goodwinii]|uniref:Uncharacterized protein n=1 Tax=Brenneria goodwinii TaxID=1109412 RepID=A0A0G4JY68_9GAMM|nr:hypothetical protein BN1221_03098 [Brenneria goodwinii]
MVPQNNALLFFVFYLLIRNRFHIININDANAFTVYQKNS